MVMVGDCRLERKRQSFEATSILNKKQACSVLCDSFNGITPALCWSLADCCPVDLLCLIICLGTGTRGGAQERSAGKAS